MEVSEIDELIRVKVKRIMFDNLRILLCTNTTSAIKRVIEGELDIEGVNNIEKYFELPTTTGEW